MPVKKTTKPRAATARPVKVAEELEDFTQFVARKPRSGRSKIWITLTLIIVIIVLSGALVFLSQGNLNKEYKYKAVFLDNGQVYFAKVIKEDALNVYLDEVYYIQTEQQLVPATEEGAQDQVIEVPILIKRGAELHQPQGMLQINRSKITSIEEVGDDSEVLKEITRQQSL